LYVYVVNQEVRL